MVRTYTIHKLDDSLLKDGKWDREALVSHPYLATCLGQGKGDIRSGAIAKSYSSRGSGYAKQEIRASKFAVFQSYLSGKEDDMEPISFLTLPNGVLTSSQGFTAKHDKSFLQALIVFVDKDLEGKNPILDPDEEQHWKYEDVSGKHCGFFTILEGMDDGKKRKYPYLVKNFMISNDTQSPQTANFESS
jgi:hypothetical protein